MRNSVGVVHAGFFFHESARGDFFSAKSKTKGFCCYSYYNSPIWPDKSSFTSCIHNKRFIEDEKEGKKRRAQERNKEVFLYYYFLSSFAAAHTQYQPGCYASRRCFLIRVWKNNNKPRGTASACTLSFLYCE